MKAADIYESAKERIRAVLLPPESSRAILAILHLRRSTISGVDREAVDVLLTTLERLAAELLEARLELAAGLGQPEGGLPGWMYVENAGKWIRFIGEGEDLTMLGYTMRSAFETEGWGCWTATLDSSEDTPRKAMRQVDAALKAAGLLP